MTESTLRDRFEEFIYQCQNVTRLRPETIKGYRAAYDLLTKVSQDADLINIQSPKFITNFFAALNNRSRKVGRDKYVQGIRKSTTATYHAKLQKFFRWMKENRYIEQNPFEKIPAPNVEYLDRKFLNKEDVQKLFHACSFQICWDDEFVRRRNTAMLAVMLYAGLRKGELLGLQITDFDMNRRTVTVRGETSKSQHMRHIPLNNEAYIIVENYLNTRKERDTPIRAMWLSQEEDRSFSANGLKHLVQKLNDESGVKFHVHQLRHTFAVNLLAKGVDISKIQQLMGHKDIRMTAKYVRCFPADEMRNDVNSMGLDGLI